MDYLIGIMIIFAVIILAKVISSYRSKRAEESTLLHIVTHSDFGTGETLLFKYKDASTKELVEIIVLRFKVDRGSFLPPREGDTTGKLWKPKNLEEVEERARLAAERFIERFGLPTKDAIWYDLPPMFDEKPEELTPYRAGRAAYCLGKQAEDNPFRDDAYLGSEWEEGFYNTMREDS